MAAGNFGLNVQVEDVEADVKIFVAWGEDTTTKQITDLLTEAYAAAVKRTFEDRPEVFAQPSAVSKIILPGEL